MEFFDVFVRCPEGKLRWIECVEDLAVAEQHAIRFSERFLGQSLIYSERDGLIVRRIGRASTTGRLVAGHKGIRDPCDKEYRKGEEQ
jgi:hypothetical protein